MSGWDDVTTEIVNEHVSSEELTCFADALKSESECEMLESGGGPCSDSETEGPRPWWAGFLFQHTKGYHKAPVTVPITVLSGCTGACSEGAVLKATRGLGLVSKNVMCTVLVTSRYSYATIHSLI